MERWITLLCRIAFTPSAAVGSVSVIADAIVECVSDDLVVECE